MRVSLDPKLLYNLHFIFESGWLSAAAKIPAVSQPTLSRAVSQLEARIGRQLMVRGRNGVKLTEARILLAEQDQIAICHAADADLNSHPAHMISDVGPSCPAGWSAARTRDHQPPACGASARVHK